VAAALATSQRAAADCGPSDDGLIVGAGCHRAPGGGPKPAPTPSPAPPPGTGGNGLPSGCSLVYLLTSDPADPSFDPTINLSGTRQNLYDFYCNGHLVDMRWIDSPGRPSARHHGG
jgi:hypothetical protein